MDLKVKLNCLLQAHAALLQVAQLPEHVRDYSVQSHVSELNKQIVEISKQISAAQTTTNTDDIPF